MIIIASLPTLALPSLGLRMTAVPVGAEESEGKTEEGLLPATRETSRAYSASAQLPENAASSLLRHLPLLNSRHPDLSGLHVADHR